MYINKKWLFWIILLGVFSSIFYGVDKGLYWTTIFAVGSVFLYTSYKIADRFFFEQTNWRFKATKYELFLLFISIGTSFVIGESVLVVGYLLLSGLLLILIINLISFIQARYF